MGHGGGLWVCVDLWPRDLVAADLRSVAAQV